MMFLLQAAAQSAPSVAAPPPVLVETLGELSEVPSLTLDKGLLTADTAWLRDGTDCIEVQLQGVQLQEVQLQGPSDKRLVSWDACPAGPIACTQKRSLGLDWGTHSFFHCERSDGTGWGGGSGSGSSGQAPRLLVRHDDQAAEWSTASSLQVAFRIHRSRTHPCTPASAEHGTPSVDGPVLVCDASEGVNIKRVPAGGCGIDARVSVSAEAIDCSRPCPVGDDQARVLEANHWLGARMFYEPDAPRHGLYATEALCMAAPPSIPLSRPDELCREPIEQPAP